MQGIVKSWGLIRKWQDKAYWFQCWYYGWLLPQQTLCSMYRYMFIML